MKHSAGRKERRMTMRANRRAAGRKLHKEHVLEQRHPKKPKAEEIVEE